MNRDVSVIMTCFNDGRLIIEAIASVVEQTAIDRVREIIVVDDGSTDDSRTILAGLAASNGRLWIFEQHNQGVASARNAAIRHASAAYVAILDADDLWLPDKLARQLPLFEQDASIGLTYTDYVLFDDEHPDDERVGCRRYHHDDADALARFFVQGGPVIPSSVIIRREVFDAVGLFDIDMRMAEDFELWTRIIARFGFEHLPYAALRKRRRPASLSANPVKRLPYDEEAVRRVVAANPALEPLVARRLARRYAHVGSYLTAKGQRAEARPYLLRALRADPWNAEAWICCGLSLLPESWLAGADRTLRRRRQVGAKLKRQARPVSAKLQA